MSEADRDRLRAFLAEMWADNTEAEAEALWKRRVARTPGYAAEALAALDAAIAQPPSDLRDILVTDGQIPLFHRPDARTVTPYTFEETTAWLRAMTARFRALYEEGHAGH